MQHLLRFESLLANREELWEHWRSKSKAATSRVSQVGNSYGGWSDVTRYEPLRVQWSILRVTSQTE